MDRPDWAFTPYGILRPAVRRSAWGPVMPDVRKPTRSSLWALAACLVCVACAPAGQAQEPAPGDTLSERELARIDRTWNRYWREVAPFYLEHESSFICVPGFDRRLPSSAGVTVDDYREQSVWEQEYTDERGRERTRTLVKPEAEAFAAVMTIQAVAPGQYGYIHSGNLVSIEDDRTAVLNAVWLVDAEAAREEKQALKAEVLRGTFEDIEDAVRDRGRQERRNRGDGIARRRAAENEAIDWGFEERTNAATRQRDRAFSRYRWTVIGYQTDRLETGARWPAGNAADEGLQLIIVAVDGTQVTAVPAALIGDGLSELQFLACLEQRGISKARFVEIVNEQRAADRTGYLPAVISAIEGTDTTAPSEPNDTVELAD